MIGKSSVVFILFILLLSSGCASRPVFTMEVYKTPTPIQEPLDPFTAMPSLQPSLTDIAVSPTEPATLPTFPPPTAALPVDFSPILYGKKYDANTFFLLLGGVQGGKWITPEMAAANIQGTSEYDLYTFANENFPVLVDAPETSPIHPGQYFMGSEVSFGQFGMVGVAHGWPVRQGKAEELSPDNEIYRQVVLDWLKEAGVPDPQPGTLHIYRIDLEGDGTDEIFISAAHLDGSQHFTKSGDYSMLLMRRVVGNTAVTLPVIADIYQSREAEITYPRTYLPGNFIDLNQDGILEVVVDYQRWEGDGALVFQIEGPKITQIP